MDKIFIFLHGLYAIPFYLSVIAVIYNKILEFKYDSNNVICNNMQIKLFEDKVFEGLSPTWIAIDILTCMGELFLFILGIGKYPSIYTHGWLLDLAIVCIIAIIYGIFYLKRKKENTLEIDIDIINEAIKAAPPGEIQKTLISARDRIIKQQRMKVVKEGIAAIDRIQESSDYIDVQYDIDRLKAYAKLEDEDDKENNSRKVRVFYQNDDGSIYTKYE